MLFLGVSGMASELDVRTVELGVLKMAHHGLLNVITAIISHIVIADISISILTITTIVVMDFSMF